MLKIGQGLKERITHSLGGYINNKEFETSIIFEPIEEPSETSFEEGGEEEIYFS